MQREIKVGQVWKYSTREEVDGTILEWIFVVVEYFGPDFRTSSNVRVILLDVPYSRLSEDMGSLQYYLIDDNIKWQLLFDV
jgi:hypothetical protein